MKLRSYTSGIARMVLLWLFFSAFSGRCEARVEEFTQYDDLQQLGGSGSTINMSGCCIMPSTGELLVIQNSTVGVGLPAIRVYDIDGTFKRSITLTGFLDTESICQYKPENDLFAVVEEALNQISLVTITAATTNLTKAAVGDIPMGLGNLANTGIEGISYDPVSNCFYAVREKPTTVYRVSGSGTGTVTEVIFTAGNVSDLSDLVHDPVSGHLFLLSDESARVAECTLDGTELASLSIPAAQPEGITLSADGHALFLVGEPNQYLKFSRPFPHHFTVGTIGSPHLTNQPFTVTITAMDETEAVVTAFSNVVGLAGYRIDSGSTVALLPDATGGFTNGVWFGAVTVLEAATNMQVRVDDGRGHFGLSNPFTTLNYPPLRLDVPVSATEGDGVLTGQGMVSITNAPVTALVVALQSGDPASVTVTNSVTILAGQTNAFFDLAIVDTSDLNGTRTVTLTASAPGFTADDAGMVVYDNDTATLFLELPVSATEGDGLLAGAGRLTVSAAPVSDVTVALASDDTGELVVPAFATIAGGTTSVVFNIIVVNDVAIDGSQAVTVTAHVQNWTDGVAGIQIRDNEHTNLVMAVPATADEGAGVLANAGSVSISGTLTNDLLVALMSSDTNAAVVPATVSIGAGTTTASFDITVVEDTLFDGIQTAAISATAPGFSAGQNSIAVADNEIHHFALAPVNSPQTASVLFGLVVAALDTNGAVIASFGGTATISAAAGGTGVSMTPATIGPFVNGQWSGNVAVTELARNVVLTVQEGGGASGDSNPFEVTHGALDHFGWTPFDATQYVNAAFAAQLTAQDDNGHRVTNFFGAVTLSGWEGAGTQSNMILGAVSHSINPGTRPGTLGYAFTPDRDITVTHVRNYYPGLFISIWDYNSRFRLLIKIVSTTPVGTWQNSPVSPPLVLAAGTRYMLGYYGAGYYARTDLPGTFADGTLHMAYSDTFRNGFPLKEESGWHWPMIDLVYTTQGQTPVPIMPDGSIGFTGGTWNGDVTVLTSVPAMFLRADDGNGHTGDSAPFSVISLGQLNVSLPSAATEGDAPLLGQGVLAVSVAPASNLVVSLQSSAPAEAAVTNQIVIASGATNAFFDIVIGNDALLDGSRPVTISASSDGYSEAAAVIVVHDNEAAVLALALTNQAGEADGVLVNAGRVSVSAAPAADVSVTLSSDDTNSVVVPATVTLNAGTTNQPFNLTIINDGKINGTRTVTIRAHVENWTDGTGQIEVFDDERTDLVLNLPAQAVEGDGTLIQAGSVAIAGTLTGDLAVSLSSSLTDEASVPVGVVIPAGLTNVNFDIVIGDDSDYDGPQSVLIGAAASGFIGANGTLLVMDNELYTLTIHSVHGTPDPAAGQYFNQRGTVISNFVARYDENGPTRYVCTGWAMAGQGDVVGAASGTATTVVLAQTNDAALTWQWNTNYWLETAAHGHGTVLPASAWQGRGTQVVVNAAVGPYCSFEGWSGSGTNFIVAGNAAAPTVTVSMASSMQLMAEFDAELATNATPLWWLDLYGLTNDWDAQALADQDGDGMPTWREHVADTVPTNVNSVLRIVAVVATTGSVDVQWQGGEAARQFLQYRSSLVSTQEPWVVCFTNEPPTAVVTNIGDPSAAGGPRFYRIGVERP